MERKKARETGIRVEVPQGTGEAVAVDELVDDLLHGNMRGVLRNLHEPGGDAEEEPRRSDA
ncbi:MAG: hypothetical protein ACK5LO_01610 [Leucobacter sp.]